MLFFFPLKAPLPPTHTHTTRTRLHLFLFGNKKSTAIFVCGRCASALFCPCCFFLYDAASAFVPEPSCLCFAFFFFRWCCCALGECADGEKRKQGESKKAHKKEVEILSGECVGRRQYVASARGRRARDRRRHTERRQQPRVKEEETKKKDAQLVPWCCISRCTFFFLTQLWGSDQSVAAVLVFRRRSQIRVGNAAPTCPRRRPKSKT
nr:hypothetical protein [Pandoravirus aubagnensis]